MKRTFVGGVHPPDFKNLTGIARIKRARLPRQVIIPLSQHTGAVCESVVSVGDAVKTGSLIGKSDKFISSYVHASVSGKVTKIENRAHPLLGVCKSVIIDSDGKDEPAFSPKQQETDIDAMGAEKIIEIIRRAGITGLGGACFPTHVKLTPPKNKQIDTFILNGAECEPYLSCDFALMLERPQEILKGAVLIMKALDIKAGIIAIEDNKPQAIEAMGKAVESLKSKAYSLKVVSLPTKYPQGAEKQIIKSALNRIVPAGALPMDVGCVVQNVGTAFAVYEAVYFSKPLIERVVTITGPCVKEPVNLWVRIGTTLAELADSFAGFVKEPARIIFGGPMMGIAQYTTNVPVIKATSGIILLPQDEVDKTKEGVCIRCSKCLDVCPIRLAPTTLMYFVKTGNFKDAKELGIENCYECGACAYECPAKIPLLDYMKFGKASILN